MSRMDISPDTANDLTRRISKCIQSGKVLAHATETCYGLACDLRSLMPVERLFDMKKRPHDQPVSALFPALGAAEIYVDMSARARELAAKYLPGPLALVLPRKADAPPLFVTASGGGMDPWIGIRVSSHPVAALVAAAAGAPLATTSANLHGEKEPYSVDDLRAQYEPLEFWPDVTIDSGTIPQVPPSTVVQVIGDEIRILRQGALVIE